MIWPLLAGGFCLFSYDGIIIERNLSDNKGSSLSVLRVCKRAKVGKAVKKLKNHELLFEEGVPGEVDVSDR